MRVLIIFNNFNLKFHKVGKNLDKNCGRSFATQQGINLARGLWCLFVRSNESVSPGLILEFKKAIISNSALAYMGVVKYKSKDKKFEKYLNNPKRGVRLYQCGDKIHYKFLLFNNSIIKRDICNKIKLNLCLTHYGGEELDFASKLNSLYPNQICACPDAVVYRKNYPDLTAHCKRLEEFGFINFKRLQKNLQLDIIRFHFLLNTFIFFRVSVFIVHCVSRFLISIIPKAPAYALVRIRLLSAILRGYYRIS